MNPIESTRKKFKQAIRDKAIKRAETRIILARAKPGDFTEDELEVILHEEEAKIYSAIKEKGLLAVLAVLGIGVFG